MTYNQGQRPFGDFPSWSKVEAVLHRGQIGFSKADNS